MGFGATGMQKQHVLSVCSHSNNNLLQISYFHLAAPPVPPQMERPAGCAASGPADGFSKENLLPGSPTAWFFILVLGVSCRKPVWGAGQGILSCSKSL